MVIILQESKGTANLQSPYPPPVKKERNKKDKLFNIFYQTPS
jgi:hypothetical protein